MRWMSLSFLHISLIPGSNVLFLWPLEQARHSCEGIPDMHLLSPSPARSPFPSQSTNSELSHCFSQMRHQPQTC